MIFPFLKSLTLYFVCHAINGFTTAYICIIPNVWVMKMFERNSKTYLQILHLFFPIGQMLGPLIYVPFIKHDNSTDNSTGNGKDEHNNATDDSKVIGTKDEQSTLEMPYLIMSLLLASVGVLVLIAYLIKVCVLHKINF